MYERYHYLLLILILLVFPCSAYSTISQDFDSEGAPVSSRPQRAATDITGKTSRYSVPEGVELHKDITYEFYPVFGKTFSEIIKSSEENGPHNKAANRRFASMLKWGLGWSYQFDYSYGIDEEEGKVHAAMDILDINVTYHITITLPTLIDDTPLNPIERNLWKIYLQRLLEHEHARAGIIQDSNSKNAVLNSIREINYLIFDYQNGSDIENTVGLFIREETSKIGREWIRKINVQLQEYERNNGPAGSTK
jgi:hypothetical protein